MTSRLQRILPTSCTCVTYMCHLIIPLPSHLVAGRRRSALRHAPQSYRVGRPAARASTASSSTSTAASFPASTAAAYTASTRSRTPRARTAATSAVSMANVSTQHSLAHTAQHMWRRCAADSSSLSHECSCHHQGTSERCGTKAPTATPPPTPASRPACRVTSGGPTATRACAARATTATCSSTIRCTMASMSSWRRQGAHLLSVERSRGTFVS
jgi:hypothetical protein